MSDLNALLDLKGLTEPVSKLIDTVGSAVGVLYEPTRIRRKAEAESDAALISAHGQIEIQELAAHASERLNAREMRRQRNIESVVVESTHYLPNTVSKEGVDEDWIAQFFEHCQDVSNEQMRTLWAKILAGEVAEPESFSLRTLNLIKLLSKTEATLFSMICPYLWSNEREESGELHLYTPATKELITKVGLIDLAFIHLQSIGLIQLNTSMMIKREKPITLFYHGKAYQFSVDEESIARQYPAGYSFLKRNEPNLNIPASPFELEEKYGETVSKVEAIYAKEALHNRQLHAYILTDSGSQLAHLSGAQSDGNYLATLTNSLKEFHIKVEAEN